VIVNQFTRDVLAARRQRRELTARGYEELGEGGGRIRDLIRGRRRDHRIVDAIVSNSGTFVWVKIEKEQSK
jgi:hypothetical protein